MASEEGIVVRADASGAWVKTLRSDACDSCHTITLVGFLFGLLHASQREGWSNTKRLLALVFGVSLLFESVGVATGWIYGPYHYTDKLGPLFLGLVPYLIPVAWFMMSYPSFIIASRLVPLRKNIWACGASCWLRWAPSS